MANRFPESGVDKRLNTSDFDAPPFPTTVFTDEEARTAYLNQSYLDVPFQSAFRRLSSDTISDVSILSADNEHTRHTGRLLSISHGKRLASRSPTPPTTWRLKCEVFWIRNKGLALVMIAQLFGVMMNVTTRLLELNGNHGPGMHPFQILFARMIGTLVLSVTYQWLAKVEHAPFGPRGVWKLLIARGFGGFFGVYGIYCQ